MMILHQKSFLRSVSKVPLICYCFRKFTQSFVEGEAPLSLTQAASQAIMS